MISFRFHLVSIVAVFLALALGILVGTTVVKQGIIEDLKNRTDAAVKRADDARKQVVDLKADLSAAQAFEGLVLPALVDGQLAGTRVVLITEQDADVSALEGTRRILTDAGATVVAEMVVTNRMGLTDDRSQADLASVLGVPNPNDPVQLDRDAAQALSARLADGPSSSPPDLLDSLHSGGFLVIRGGAGGNKDIGGAGQVIVLLAGSSHPPTVDPGLFLAPLAGALVEAERPVAAAESDSTVASFVPLLRSDDSLDGHMVTVDNVDEVPGRVALVLGLRDLIASPGSGGDYGRKAGASALIPKP
ncbi:MAG: copper transporter [Actinobacteria bacterium]|nr:MAG: copper transporter [Actinomycetota bacterium]